MTTLHQKHAPANELRQWGELIGDIATVAAELPTPLMEELMSGLSPEARDIVLSYVVDGERFTSIGRRYGRTDEWARLRFHRAKDVIRRNARDIVDWSTTAIAVPAASAARSRPLSLEHPTPQAPGRSLSPDEVAALVAKHGEAWGVSTPAPDEVTHETWRLAA